MGRVALKEKAYSYLLDSIIDNKIPYNAPLIETEYAELLQMSRTPIREAIKQLEAEGLVYKIADRGSFVKEITRNDIDEICELRKMFELQALRYSIEKITKADMAECRMMLERLNSESSAQEFFHADKSFHKLVMKYCPNQRLVTYYKNLENQIARLRRTLSVLEGHYLQVQRQHIELLDVLETRDYERMSNALAAHLDEIQASIIEVQKLQRSESWAL